MVNRPIKKFRSGNIESNRLRVIPIIGTQGDNGEDQPGEDCEINNCAGIFDVNLFLDIYFSRLVRNVRSRRHRFSQPIFTDLVG